MFWFCIEDKSEYVILNFLVFNRILSSIKMFLHNWRTANVGFFNLTSLLESQELLSVGSLIHSLALWLSQNGILLDLTDSRVVGEQIFVTVLLAHFDAEIENIKTHSLFLTGKRCVKIELEVVQVKRSWGSMWLLVSSHLTCIARFVHTIASLRESFGSVTVVETTVSLELTFFALGVWVVHAGVSLILSRSHIWV